MIKNKISHKCQGFEPNQLLYLNESLNDDVLKLKIKEIKRQIRSVMNGVASTSMNEKGLSYKVNYGVPFVILKSMAEKYEKNHELAQLMWCENVRELNILATFVQPFETFTVEIANSWIERITQSEQSEQICINLLQHVSFAKKLIMNWLERDEEMVRLTAWLLLARVANKLYPLSEDEILFILKNAKADIQRGKSTLFNGALLGLKRVGRVEKRYSEQIINEVNGYSLLDENVRLQICDDLKFEFEYYRQTSL
ncbi:MAG: DNA alkylation repair protein [Bacteroidales bacterium]|nr:DNA alkylation repair protein [Bacteroidales bacterium]